MGNVLVGKLSNQVYQILREDILTGRIELGEKLINKSLQERFGVSSTPIRDAINHLYQDGLVEEICNVGARVILFDCAFALEINEILSVLSSAALRMCGRSPQRGELRAAIDATLLEMEQVRTQEAYIAVDRGIHLLPFQYCGNEQLKKLHEKYHSLAEMIVNQSFKTLEEMDICARHEGYLRALRAGEIARAVEQMQVHYDLAAEEIRQFAAGE